MSSQNRKLGVQKLWQTGSQQKGMFIEEINSRDTENNWSGWSRTHCVKITNQRSQNGKKGASCLKIKAFDDNKDTPIANMVIVTEHNKCFQFDIMPDTGCLKDYSLKTLSKNITWLSTVKTNEASELQMATQCIALVP